MLTRISTLAALLFLSYPALADDPEATANEDALREEAVKTKAFPIVQHERDGDSSETKVGNLIIAEGYHHERHGDHQETEFLDLPFLSVLKTESSGDDHREVRFIKAPFTRVFESESRDGGHDVRVLDVPFFSLVESESDPGGAFDNKAIKLPIIGSLFRHQRTDEKEKVRFLFFSHTRHFDEDGQPEPRNNQPVSKRTGSRRPIR